MTALAEQHNIAQQPMGDLGDDWKGNKADVPAQIESPNAHVERQQTATKNLAHEQVSWTQLENLKVCHWLTFVYETARNFTLFLNKI